MPNSHHRRPVFAPHPLVSYTYKSSSVDLWNLSVCIPSSIDRLSWRDTPAFEVQNRILRDVNDILPLKPVQALGVVRLRDRHVDRQRPHGVVLCMVRAVGRRGGDARVLTDPMPRVAGGLVEADADDDQREHDTLRRARKSALPSLRVHTAVTHDERLEGVKADVLRVRAGDVGGEQ